MTMQFQKCKSDVQSAEGQINTACSCVIFVCDDKGGFLVNFLSIKLRFSLFSSTSLHVGRITAAV